MTTNLDNIDSRSAGSDTSALEQKVTNLSNIAAKTNIANTFTANQTVNGAVIVNSAPTADNHLTNKEYVDDKINFKRVVNHTSALAANTDFQWTIPANTLQANQVNELSVVIPINQIDLEFSVQMMVSSITYTNMGRVVEFATSTGLDSNIKCKLWIHDNKIKFRCSSATNGLRVYYRVSSVV